MSVLNFATSPNSGVKFYGGFLRSEKRFFAIFLLAVRRFLSFVLFFCCDRATHAELMSSHCLQKDWSITQFKPKIL